MRHALCSMHYLSGVRHHLRRIICAASFARQRAKQSKAKQSRSRAEAQHNVQRNSQHNAQHNTQRNAQHNARRKEQSRADTQNTRRETQATKRETRKAQRKVQRTTRNAQRTTHNTNCKAQSTKQKHTTCRALRGVHRAPCIVTSAQKNDAPTESARQFQNRFFENQILSQMFSFPHNQPRRLKQSARLNVQPRFIFVWHFFTIL